MTVDDCSGELCCVKIKDDDQGSNGMPFETPVV